MYVDTDSCVYVSKPGGPKPATGDFLGDLTSEITPKHGQGAYITQFLCGGPKNYAYKVNNGKTHCKIRGFTLNYKNSLVLNFDSLKDIICRYVNRPARENKKSKKNKGNVNSVNIVNECKISRERWTRRIVNRREVKEYKVVFDKRILLGKGEDTIPYGFHWIPSTNKSVIPTSIIPVPDSLLYTLIQPSSTVWQQGNGMDLMAHDEPMVIDHGEDGMVSDDDDEMRGDDEDETMDTNEKDIDLMETDDERVRKGLGYRVYGQ